MATADELLSTIDTDKTLIIDKDLRTIIIPSSVKNLGVESDDDVLRLKFSMPRMYGDVDLSDFSIYINYMNAKNTGDVYVVDDKTIADDTITFSWLVGRVALAYKGNVRFIVCMKKHDDNSNVIQEYNTTIASLPVLEGLETGETVIQQNPDIIEMLLTSLEPLVGTTQTVTPSQVLAAIKVGRDIALQYTDSYYGVFVFSAFNVNEKLGIVVSNSILPQWDGLTGTLLGFVEDAGWIFKATKTATKDDVGTAVNEALTAAKASGEFDGADGITPTIGNNGNWFLGDTDTGKPSRGEKGDKGDTGAQGIQGEKGDTGAAGATGADGKSAYSYAQEGGYTGTVEEFAAKLAAEKLPNPYPLTFTGAVSETYDGSSAKTITIPSGGGGGGAYTAKYIVAENVSSYTLNIDTSKYSGYVIFVRNSTNKAPSITINREHKRIGFTGQDANVNFFEINTLSSDDIFRGFSRLQKNNNISAVYYSYGDSNHASGTTEENNGIVISAATIAAGSEIFVRCM